MISEKNHRLLEQWRSGDQEAGKELLLGYVPALRRYFDRRWREETEELVQQTLLSALRVGEKLRDARNFRAYLFRIANSRLVDLARHRRVHQQEPLSSSRFASADTTQGSRVQKNEMKQAISDCLSSLPEHLRAPLELHYLDGFQLEEVASILDLPLGTAKSRMRLGRDKFARIFDARYAEYRRML